jgi:hypothetical protein
MKKILFGLFTIFVLFTGNAQTDQGNMFIGGTLNFGTSSFFNPDSTGSFKGSTFDFAIAPEFGFFVSDNFAIGANIFFGTANAKTYDIYFSDARTSKVSEFGIGGGLFGQYFIELDKDLFLTFKGTLGFYHTVGETSVTAPSFFEDTMITTIGARGITNELSFVIVPSIEYFVNDNLSLSLGFGDLHIGKAWNKNMLLSNPVSVTTTDFGLNLDLSTLRFGMKFYLDN